MSRDSEMISRLIDQYGLSRPLTKEEKKRINSSSKRVLKNILKKTGHYNIFVAIYLYIFYLCRNFRITMLTFSIIVSSVLIVLVAILLLIKFL